MAKGRGVGERTDVSKVEESPLPIGWISLVFCALVLSSHLLMWFLPRGGIEALQKLTAASSAFLLDVSGLTVRLNGSSLALPNALWTVTPECTAITAMFVFLAFVFAYPARMKMKLLAALVGVPLLFAANLVRLFALGWAMYYSREMAGYIHDYIWQIAFLVLVASMWMAWLRWVVNRGKQC